MCSCSGASTGVIPLAKLWGGQQWQWHLPWPWAQGQDSPTKTLCTSWLVPLVPPFYCLQNSLWLNLPAMLILASFGEAHPAWKKPICLKGSVMKDDCDNCGLVNLHIWRLIHVLHSVTAKYPGQMTLFLKIDWLLQNKQANRDETAQVHLIAVL